MPRARSLSRPAQTTREELNAILEQTRAILDPITLHDLEHRPRTAADCPDSGPCAYVGCRHHLYLDVHPEHGTIKLNFPDRDPTELDEPCSLRLARQGGMTLEECADRLNFTRERARQIEAVALRKLKRKGVPG